MRPLPGYFLFVLCLGRPCSATVGAWVNSAQSLRPLPAFVCIVVFGLGRWYSATCGCVGKFRTIVAAVAGFCLCCVWGGGAAQLCGCVGKFRTIIVAIAGFCLCCCVWRWQHNFWVHG